MYISELELQGFKSFAHKTKVKFNQGITAIVGPNGCGKSNIVDSLRWVLGEQRPTLLRSTSMSNIIFNGTAQKNALGLAEVSLTFINNKGLLPTEYSEVTISRRLYRSGESEYLINDTECRLKDIMELFMDTGMSSDAYSVIELKMVEEILTNKNNDRRRLFEEAAGITSYKDKRKKTLRKLDKTRDDLQRVEDLVAEIRKKVKSLGRQAEKARKSKKYSQELTHLDKALNSHKYRNIQQELKPLEKRIKNAEKEKKEIQSKSEKLESAEAATRKSLSRKEKQEAESQRRVSQINTKVHKTQTNLQITREKISNEQNVISQYDSDIAQAKEDLKELLDHFKHNKSKLDRFDNELQKAAENLASSKEKYTNIQKQYDQEHSKLTGIGHSLSKSQDERNRLETRRVKIESRLENTDEEIKRIKNESVDLKNDINDLQASTQKLKKKIKEIKAKYDQHERALQKARRQREELAEQQNQLKDQIRTLQSKRDSIQSEIDLLQDIAHSNEAFPGSVKFLTEQHAADFELLQVVSNILSTDEEHAVALEAVLGNALNYVVVETLADARRAAGILKEKNQGQATFIPLNQLQESYNVHPHSLARAVETQPEFTPINQLLLGHVVMCDSVVHGFENLSSGITGVTSDGEVVITQQFLLSGSARKNAGMRVGLKDKIEKLESKATSFASKIKTAQTELSGVNQSYESIDLAEIEKQLNETRRVLRKKEDLVNSYLSKIQVYQSNVQELEKRKATVQSNKASSGKTLKQLAPHHDKLNKKINELNEKQNQKKEALEHLEEERSIAQSRFNDARLKHQNLENKVQNHQQDIQRAERGIKNLKERIEARTRKKEEAREKIKEYESRIDLLEDTLTEATEDKKTADAALESAKNASAAQRGEINQIEKNLKEVRQQKEVNMELVHHLSMAKEKFEMQAGNISDHIWETYEMLMDQITVDLHEDTDADEAKQRIEWLRKKLKKLGEVNALAVEEYEEEKRRLDFYKEQIEDLNQARKELVETIEKINKTATERFNNTFSRIRSNFQHVFHTLFNDDDFCDLTIDQEADDPLEAKIEIEANPRGKRPSTINQLSGGEKTLTAIALLFAIYLVKPSPFCVLDEVDAPLDDANIERFADMIKRFSQDTQFIIITHNKKTMVKAEMMYGVTMPETGISRLVGVQMDEVMEA